MVHPLLLREKDKVTTHYQLALFTSSVEDNLKLAARIAHLEMEAASVAYGSDAFPHLVSAAAFYKVLDRKQEALVCLQRASLLGATGETAGLLAEAITDLEASMKPAPAKPAPPPPPVAKEAPKVAPRPAKVEEPAKIEGPAKMERPKSEKVEAETKRRPTLKGVRPKSKETKKPEKDD